jgi:hypothetical protein
VVGTKVTYPLNFQSYGLPKQTSNTVWVQQHSHYQTGLKSILPQYVNTIHVPSGVKLGECGGCLCFAGCSYVSTTLLSAICHFTLNSGTAGLWAHFSVHSRNNVACISTQSPTAMTHVTMLFLPLRFSLCFLSVIPPLFANIHHVNFDTRRPITDFHYDALQCKSPVECVQRKGQCFDDSM